MPFCKQDTDGHIHAAYLAKGSRDETCDHNSLQILGCLHLCQLQWWQVNKGYCWQQHGRLDHYYYFFHTMTAPLAHLDRQNIALLNVKPLVCFCEQVDYRSCSTVHCCSDQQFLEEQKTTTASTMVPRNVDETSFCCRSWNGFGAADDDLFMPRRTNARAAGILHKQMQDEDHDRTRVTIMFQTSLL